jgi:hypothetical protein
MVVWECETHRIDELGKRLAEYLAPLRKSAE